MRIRIHSTLWKHRGLVPWVLGAASTLACQSSTNPAAPRASQEQPSSGSLGAESKRQTFTLPAQMRQHGERSRELFDAAISADLEGVRRAGRELAEDDWSPALRPDWRESYAKVRSAARGVADAATPLQALKRFTDMGDACASCHEASKVPAVPAFTVSSLPEESMLRHRLAAERMWLGLSAPSDTAWKEGARELRQAPLVRSDSEDIEVLAHRVRSLAGRAEEAPRPERGKLLAEVLVSCGECHEALGLAPGSVRAPAFQAH